MPFGSLSNVLEVKSAEGFRGSSVLQQSYPLTGYTVGAAPTPPAFTPLSLFSGGVQGVWYDPSDLTTMFQDSAGTTPVGTPGNGSAQPVGLLLDKSQNYQGISGLARYNGLIYSEQFDNGAWVKENLTITANAAVAPDGTTTADKLIASAANTNHDTYQGWNSGGFITPVVGSIMTVSCAVKAAGYNYAQVGISTNDVRYVVVVDLTNGSVTDTATKGTPTSTSYSVTSLGNGWYRVSVSEAVATGSTAISCDINICPSNSATPTRNAFMIPTFLGDGTSGIYAWGADVRLASQAALTPTYQPITSSWIATLAGNHATQSTASSRPELSALVNQLTYSQDYSNAVWTKENVTLTANTTETTDPFGTNTATKFTLDSATAEHRFYQSKYSNSSNKVLVYVKAGTAGYISISRGVSTDSYAVYDLTTGTVSSQSGTVTSVAIASAGNGWYACSLTPPSSGWGYIVVKIGTTATNAIPQNAYADAGKYLYVCGVDLREIYDVVGQPIYQKVADTYTYDANGFFPYLAGDGVNRFMSAGNVVNLLTYDLNTFCGIKITGAGTSAITGKSPSVSVAGRYGYLKISGAVYSVYTNNSGDLNAAYTDSYTGQRVFSFLLNRSAGYNRIRLNGSQVANTTFTAESTNYSNAYRLLVGAAGDSTDTGQAGYFNGRIYSIIIRRATSTTAEVSNTEAWVNSKTGAY